MTSTSITTRQRPTEAVCSSWCLGHDDQGFQSWEGRDEGESRVRDHADWGVIIGGVHVGVVQVEDEATGMRAPVVTVTSDSLELTHDLDTHDAINLGIAILKAAELLHSEPIR